MNFSLKSLDVKLASFNFPHAGLRENQKSERVLRIRGGREEGRETDYGGRKAGKEEKKVRRIFPERQSQPPRAELRESPRVCRC